MVALALLGTTVLATGAHRLRLRTDGHALVPKQAPPVLQDLAIRQEFGIQDLLVLFVESRHSNGIYNPNTLRRVHDLTTKLQAVPGIDSASVASLATERGFRFRPGSLALRFLLEPFPSGPDELERLREDIETIELYTGTLVSADGRSAAILAGVAPDADRTTLCARVDSIVARLEPVPDDIHLIGAPAAEAWLGSHILEDLGVPRSLTGRFSGPRISSRHDASGRGLFVGLVPIALAVMALVFFLAFRNPTGVLLPLVEAAACVASVLGLMGWMGVPVYLTMAILPVLLVVIAVTDEIHIFSRYTQKLGASPRSSAGTPDIVETVQDTMQELCGPIVKTSATTAAGFLSFAVSPIEPIRMFGVFAAAGILFAMLWSLTVVPASLVLLGTQKRVWSLRSDRPWAERLAQGLGRRALGARGFVLVATFLGVALIPFGARHLVVQDSWIEGFSKQSSFYGATQAFNKQFFGTHTLLVVLDAGSLALSGTLETKNVDHHELRLPGDLVPDPVTLVGCSLAVMRRASPPDSESSVRQPRWSSRIETARKTGSQIVVTMPLKHGSPRFLLRPEPHDTLAYVIRSQRFVQPALFGEVQSFEVFLESRSDLAVGGVLGPSDYLATTQFFMKNRDPQTRYVPEDLDRIHRLWRQYGGIRGTRRLRQAVDADYGRVLIRVFMKNANYVDTERLLNEIRDYEDEHLRPLGVRVELGGDVVVSQTMIEGIVTSQVRSLLVSLFAVLVVASLLNRSIRWGLLCVLPCGLAVGACFAVMGWLSIPLGIATSMFAGITLGVGVDFAIHLVDRYRIGRKRGMATDAALVDAIGTTGPAILVDGLALCLGLAVLVLSQVPPNARLGLLCVVAIASSLVATLFVVPALLAKLARSTR